MSAAQKKPAAGKNTKKKAITSDKVRQLQMQIVTAEVCERCPTVCARGERYLEKMSQAGAVGFGVPCHLRKK